MLTTVAELRSAGVRTLADARRLAADEASHVGARVAAIWLLGILPDPDGAASEGALLAAAEAIDTRVRSSALISLGYLGRSTSVDRLVEALKDDDAFVRESAANALAEIGAPTSVDALIASLSDPRETPAVRGEVAKALGFTHSPEAFEPLVQALGDEDAEVRFFAAVGLGELGDPRAIDALKSLAAQDRAEVSIFGTVAEAATGALEALSDQQ